MIKSILRNTKKKKRKRKVAIATNQKLLLFYRVCGVCGVVVVLLACTFICSPKGRQ